MTQAAPKRRLVVDACVVLKWQLDDEEHVDSALTLRDDLLLRDLVELHAPVLLHYELTNGVWAAARRARLAARLAREALDNLLATGIALHPSDAARLLDLALRFGITAYDAAYVALAQQLGSELWTADRPLFDAVRRRLPWVRWIADYPAR
ncbi:MAG TPA: type II toxin-antitoxin system VapC family toxin [Dehalococcoidia bacterium]|nr:type II toxin-antitoxin system VapC family toxin [Dehalococcoidia bacterium]